MVVATELRFLFKKIDLNCYESCKGRNRYCSNTLELVALAAVTILPIYSKIVIISYWYKGEGRNAVYLAEQGMKETAWDFSESGLVKTNKLEQERGVEVSTKLVDLNETNWTEALWDEIVCIFGHFLQQLYGEGKQAHLYHYNI